MKKNFIYLLVLVALLPGCFNRKKQQVDKNGGTLAIPAEKVGQGTKGDKNLFLDEEVGAFEFEEESDAFSANAMQKSTKLNLVESLQGREWEERRAEQSKYGFKNIYFDFDQYTIRPDQEAALARNLAAVKKLTQQGRSIVVEGHACNSAGSEPYNLQLSAKRAETVKQYLVKHGVPAKQIKTAGRGFEMCIVPVGTREQQAPNRRIELYVASAEA